MLIYSESNVYFRSKDIDCHRPKLCLFWSFFHREMVGYREAERGKRARVSDWDLGHRAEFE